jgi:dihydroflavonol-4-reductase
MRRGSTLVTGATGFIGSYVVRQLLADGVATRVLVRRPELLPPDVRARVEVARGDVRDRGAVRAAVPGADTVLHLAACARAWSRDPMEFTAVNVDAVETLPPRRPAPVAGLASRPTAYEASKRAGERLVESYAAAGRKAVIVHPARVYGPGPCNDANAVTRVIDLYLRGRFRVRLDDEDVLGSYVHAADVAAGIRRAAAAGRAGAHYVLGGDNLSFRDFLALVAELTSVRRRVVALPRPAALAAGYLALWWGRLGGAAPITPGWIRVFLEDRPADSEPARRELGYAPRPVRAGVAETIAWLSAA